MCVCVCVCVCRSVVSDSAAPWTVACQASLSTESSRQESWSGLPFPSPEERPNPGLHPGLLHHRQILYHLRYREVRSGSELTSSGCQGFPGHISPLLNSTAWPWPLGLSVDPSQVGFLLAPHMPPSLSPADWHTCWFLVRDLVCGSSA